MLIKNLLSKNNTEALYREGRGFSHIMIQDVIATEERMSATIQLIRKPGYQNDRPYQWNIDVAWDFFSYSEERWAAPYLSMAVYFDDHLLELLDKFCLQLPEGYTMEHHNAISTFIDKHLRSVRA